MKADRRNTEFGGTLTSDMVPGIGVAMQFSWMKPMKLSIATPSASNYSNSSVSE